MLFYSSGEVKFVLLGELVLNSTDDDALPTQYTVVERIVHDGYRRRSKYHNIALLRLDRRVEFNRYIRPACLATAVTDDKLAIATDYGRYDIQGTTVQLLQAELHIYSPMECAETYPKSGMLKNGYVHEQQMCAGIHSDRDTCQVDRREIKEMLICKMCSQFVQFYSSASRILAVHYK